MIAPCNLKGLCVAALLATLPASAGAAEEPAVATVNGGAITLRDLASMALEEYRDSERGKEALEQAIDEVLAAHESERRGITVSQAEITARVARLEDQMRASSQEREALADHLKRQGLTAARFRELLGQAIACEIMIRADFGLREKDPIPPEKQTVWFKQQRLQSTVELTDLPAGVVARADGREVLDEDWGHKIYESLSSSEKDRILEDCILVVLLDQEAKRLEIEVSAADVDEELLLRDEELAGKLRAQGLDVDGVTYRSILEARGGSMEAYLASARFRATMLQRLIAEKRYGGDGYRGFYRDHADLFARRFGRKVHAFLLFLKAGDARTAEVPRTWSEAEEELAGLSARMDAAELEAGFARLARVYSEHSSRARGGDLGFVTAADLTPFLESSAELLDAPLNVLRGPLHVQGGAALFLVTERREAQTLEQILDTVVQEARRQVTQSLRESADIQR